MTETFECPSCGGPLDLPQDSSPTIRCPYCGRLVIIPAELRGNASAGVSDSPKEPGEELLQEIDRLVASGKEIAAIKQYKNATGSSLRDARDFVERREAGEEAGTIRSSEKLSTPSTLRVEVPGRRRPRRRQAVWAVAAIVLVIMVLISLPAITGPGRVMTVLFSGSQNRIEATRLVFAPSLAVSTLAPPPTRPVTPTPLPFAQQIFAFGEEGIGPGQFEDARSLAVSPAGDIYVGEYTGGRIQAFDSTGKFITQWLVNPDQALRGLAVDREGVLYVIQGGRIQRYEVVNGESLGALDYSQGRGFDDVAVGADGGLVTAWYNNRDDLVLFDREGQVIRTISGAISGQSGESELNTRVAVDGLGNLYALGTFNDAVFKFNSQGRFLTRFGSAGDEPGQFRAPSSIAVDGQGRVYVGDFKGIQIFDTNGRFLELIEVEGVPSGLAINDAGDLFVAARTQVIVFQIND